MLSAQASGMLWTLAVQSRSYWKAMPDWLGSRFAGCPKPLPNSAAGAQAAQALATATGNTQTMTTRLLVVQL